MYSIEGRWDMPCQQWWTLFLCLESAFFSLISFLVRTYVVMSILGLWWIPCLDLSSMFSPILILAISIVRILWNVIQKRAKIDFTHLFDPRMNHDGSDRFDLIFIDRGPGSCVCMFYVLPKVVSWRVVQMEQWGGNGSLVFFENLRADLRWLYVLEWTRRLFRCFSRTSLVKWAAALWLGRLMETLKVLFAPLACFLMHINKRFFHMVSSW